MRKFAIEIPSQLHICIWIFYNNPLQSRELPNVNFIYFFSICWFHYYVNLLMYLYSPLDMHMKLFKRSIHVGQTMSTSKCNCSFINKDEYYEDFFLFFQSQRFYFNRVTKESSQLLFHDRRYKKGGLIRMLL